MCLVDKFITQLVKLPVPHGPTVLVLDEQNHSVFSVPNWFHPASDSSTSAFSSGILKLKKGSPG
jgi:hypothetical protein